MSPIVKKRARTAKLQPRKGGKNKKNMKVDETASNTKVMIPVCDEHGQLTSSVYCFVTQQVGVQNEHCSVAFYFVYTQVRLPLVQNDTHK